MKVNVNGEQQDYRTVWMEGSEVCMIDQPKLPHRFEIYRSKDYRETTDAIKNMIVRGAPAIGATAAYGMAQAALEFSGNDMEEFSNLIHEAAATLTSARPTAYDLFHAVDEIESKLRKAKSVSEALELARKAAKEYADKSAERCKKIGEAGEKFIKENSRILTHCNAGALACVDYGTALSPIRLAKYNGKEPFVFVDETRPRCQGSRLTSWELIQEEIDHSIIVDNAAGHFMQKGEIDIVIVGADRIAKNGDIANKIGTYEKAVLAKENGIPFYVAAPESTFDRRCATGADIAIEERGEDEVLSMFGIDENGNPVSIKISPGNSKARNPAFDVTPAKYITGIITENGILTYSHD